MKFPPMPKTERIILGIDPGTAITGYGLLHDQVTRFMCLDYGCIRTSADISDVERLHVIHQELRSIIKQYQPAAAGVEKLFFAKNTKTAMAVSQARGVILLTLTMAKVPVFEFTPLEVKQAVTAHGRADKTQVQQMVKTLLNLKEIPRPDDAADALAVALCCAQQQHFTDHH